MLQGVFCLLDGRSATVWNSTNVEVIAMRLGLTATEFLDLAKEYSMVPVWAEFMADLETPMSVVSRLSPCDCLFILESAEQGMKVGRYSFVCFHPLMIFESTGNSCLVVEGTRSARTIADDPLAVLEDMMAAYRSPHIDGLLPLLGGCVGYVGYDYVRLIETLPDYSEPSKFPEITMAVPRYVLAFDHLRHTLTAVVNCQIGSHASEGQYEAAVNELANLVSHLGLNAAAVRSTEDAPSGAFNSRIFETYQRLRRTNPGIRCASRSLVDGEVLADRPSFEQSVRNAKHYIAAGDVLQVVLSRRVVVPVRSSALAVYRALRYVNPSPYMFLLDFGHMQVVGASPEMLVRLNGRDVEVRPIAGTRRRGSTAEEDGRLENELLTDAKERAEHAMLVELSKDDLGRVCVPGTVRVEEEMHVERYSHVMHMVSSVKGELAPMFDQYDLFRATFPAGTVTGAPRLRAMEIIEEQERTRRGIYAGAVGYFGASGNMDMCIAIRTLVMADGLAQVQVGAGIVAQSDPAREYEETVEKAQAINRALQLAADLELQRTSSE